jgi:hypothetical protein
MELELVREQKRIDEINNSKKSQDRVEITSEENTPLEMETPASSIGNKYNFIKTTILVFTSSSIILYILFKLVGVVIKVKAHREAIAIKLITTIVSGVVLSIISILFWGVPNSATITGIVVAIIVTNIFK